MFAVGQTVGNYRILAKLGTGGMGAVYLAEHPLIGKKVALKVIHRELAGNREVVQRFFQEARAVNTIGHENIVEIHDFGQTPQGDHFYIMEYLDGRTLASVIARERQLDVLRALHIGVQLCNGLAAAHACGVIHRDLKPDNVMLLQRQGNPDFVKILDFGLAKMFASGQSPLTAMGVILGTPQYMSPEACESKRDVDHRTDVYAVGVLLFQMLTGVLPFDGASMGEVLVKQVTQLPPAPRGYNPDIPPSVEQIVLRCLAKAADGRFPTMMALRDALMAPDAYLASSPPMAAARSVAPGEGPTVAAVLAHARARTAEPFARPGTEQGRGNAATMALGHAPTVGLQTALAPTAAQPTAAPGRPQGLGGGAPAGGYGPSGPTMLAGQAPRPGTGPVVPGPQRAGAEARTMMAPGLAGPGMPGPAEARESGVVIVPPVLENRTMIIATPVGYSSAPRPRWRIITLAAALTLVAGTVALVLARRGGEDAAVTETTSDAAKAQDARATAPADAARLAVVDAAASRADAAAVDATARVDSPADAAPPADAAAAARDAQTAAPPPAALEVQIDTVPTGAEIWVAGVERGAAPVTLRFDPSTRKVTIEARLAGYATKRQTIEVSDKMSLQLNLQKVRRNGSTPRPPVNDLMRP